MEKKEIDALHFLLEKLFEHCENVSKRNIDAKMKLAKENPIDALAMVYDNQSKVCFNLGNLTNDILTRLENPAIIEILFDDKKFENVAQPNA